MRIYLFQDIGIAANANGNSAQVAVPPGNWFVVSFLALASEPTVLSGVSANVVTTGVETLVGLNEVERLRATENGTTQALVVGPVSLAINASKKIALGQVLVRVVLTLEQS